MIDAACFVVVAELCLRGIQTVEVKDRALNETVLITGEGFTAYATFRSDFKQTPDWRRMDEACTSGACVAYHKHCVWSANRIRCVYSYSQPGDMENRTISIDAQSEARIKEAEDDIAILVRAGWRTRKIYLKAMANESADPEPPLCDRHAKQMECWSRPGQ